MHTIIEYSLDLRLLKAAALALLATLALLFGMVRLIHTDEVPVIDEPAPAHPDVHWKEIEIEDRISPKPQPVEPSDPPPVIPQLAKHEPSPLDPVDLPTVSLIKEPIKHSIGHDSMPFAKVMVAPQYPARASRRGIEGYVDVRFDVTEYGATENISVLAANPQNYFEDAAIKAVASWKFNPHTIGGKPTRYEGMSQRVRFELEK